jgi:hypothetical protein
MTLLPSGGTESHVLFSDMCNEEADLPSCYPDSSWRAADTRLAFAARSS